MSTREKRLAAAVAVLILACVLLYGADQVGTTFRQRHQAIISLKRQVRDKQLQVERGREASRLMDQYTQRSLPADREMAHGLYQTWLMQIVKDTGLSDPSVRPLPIQVSKDLYQQLAYKIVAKGKLEQILQFFSRFYSTDHLHRIHHVKLTPDTDPAIVGLDLTIDALAMHQAPLAKELRTAESSRWQPAQAAEWIQQVVARNPFSPATPAAPAPPADQPITNHEDAKLASITGVIIGERPEIWLALTKDNRTLQLAEGAAFQVGSLTGVVDRIGARLIHLTLGGQPLVARVGRPLNEAQKREEPKPAGR